MSTQSNSDVALLPPLSGSPVPDRIYVSQEEWDSITDEQRQFLMDAAEVSMAHVIENGEVIAWGPGLAQFTMAVDVVRHPQDGWVVTLPENTYSRNP